jgi:hypothetical protein
MQKGIFKSLGHEHYFFQENQITIMKDVFMFESPLGFLGKIANRVILERYLTSFLQERNLVIKQIAESGKWRDILKKLLIINKLNKVLIQNSYSKLD